MNKYVAGVFLFLALIAATPQVLAQNPFLVGKDSGKTLQNATPPNPVLAKIGIWQGRLNHKITTLARQTKNTGSLKPLISLLLLSFLYGVLHAIGPGHGKAVTGSYVFSHGGKIKQGLMLGVLIPVFHGASAILLVCVVRFMLEKSVSGSMQDITRFTQLISYGLITAIGVIMLVAVFISIIQKNSKNRKFVFMETKNHGVFAVALAVGLVPCPGVVLVMLYCLSLNLMWLGLLLAASQILGMAITICAVIFAGLGARKLLTGNRLPDSRAAKTLKSGVEISGALAIMMLGLVFLASVW